MNEFAGTMTSSPGPMPSARSASDDRLGAGGDADRVVGLAVGGELGLEGLELVAHRERAGRGDAGDDLEQLLEQRGVGRVEPEQRDGGGGGGRAHQAATFDAHRRRALALGQRGAERAAAAVVQAVDRRLGLAEPAGDLAGGEARRGGAAR